MHIDRMKPVNIEELSQIEGCFGKMWDPQHRSCAVCADVDICGAVFQANVVIPKKQKFEESLPLDMTDFKNIDWDKLTKLVTKYELDGSPLTYDELFDLIQEKAKIKDDYMTKIYIEKSLESNSLKHNEEGNIVRNA